MSYTSFIRLFQRANDMLQLDFVIFFVVVEFMFNNCGTLYCSLYLYKWKRGEGLYSNFNDFVFVHSCTAFRPEFFLRFQVVCQSCKELHHLNSDVSGVCIPSDPCCQTLLRTCQWEFFSAVLAVKRALSGFCSKNRLYLDRADGSLGSFSQSQL